MLIRWNLITVGQLDMDDTFTSTLRGKQAVMPATDYANFYSTW